MIHAVCFERKALTDAVLGRICRETGACGGGRLVDEALVNCIESMPDGTVWLSFMRDVPSGVVNCGCDVERFIQVNRHYGLTAVPAEGDPA